MKARSGSGAASPGGVRLPGWLRGLLLVSLPVLAASVAILEFGLFRYFVVVDDNPRAVYDAGNQILKYWPRQTGVRYPDRDRRHPVTYSINDDGWNSPHRTYATARTGRSRIAIVGDSFVEALQVNPDESVAARLESALGPESTEVYSFGLSGSPLSQYLHVARYVARTFHPDAIVVIIVHNDFIESYREKPLRFSQSFLRLEVADTVREIAPLPYESPRLAQSLLARSATLRFGFFVWRRITDLSAMRPAPGDPQARFEANVNVAELDREKPRIERAVTYLFDQFARLQRTSGARLLLVMDGPREAVYAGRDARSLDVYRLNRIALAAADAAGIPILDLTDAFVEEYKRSGRRFDFALDNHWNVEGHALAAREIAGRLPIHMAPPGASGVYRSPDFDQNTAPAGAAGRSASDSSERVR